jgi:predicted RNA-binding Zn-ribbon protein involved in translation (DUF1610 family)
MMMDNCDHDATDHNTFLRSYLADRDEDCPMCSYNLRGLTGPMCPECGEALRMRVSLCEPKMGLYLCGVIGWAVGAGFSGFMLGWVMFLWLTGNFGPGILEFWPLIVQFIVQGSVLGLSLWKGRWIRKKSTMVRRSLAASAWVLSFVLAVGFFMIVS